MHSLAVADPAPLLHQQFPASAIGLEIERGDDIVACQHRQREIAEHPLFLWHVRLETMLVIEEKMRALALDDQRVERREDVNQLRAGFAGVLQRLKARPM